jgi:hypothetical protein
MNWKNSEHTILMKTNVLLVSLICLASVNVRAVNLVLNGSFESGSFSQNSIYPGRMSLANGSTVINNWVAGRGTENLWWMQAPNYNAQSGNFAVDLDSNGTAPFSFIEQTFSTIVGQQYQFAGYFASEGNGGPASTSVLINGNLIGTATTGSGAGDPGPGFNNLIWTPASFAFTASSTSSTLRLQDATVVAFDGVYYNPIIDNISVMPVPEPSSGLLFAVLLGLFVLGRKTLRTKF